MENLSSPLTKMCNACGKTRKRKGIMYHPVTYMPYCEDAYLCNAQHPNTPAHLIERGEKIELISFEEAQERMLTELDENTPDRDRFKKIQQLIQKPASIRFQSIQEIEFLLDMKTEYHISSMSEAVRFCVNAVREGYIPEKPEIATSDKEPETEEPTESEQVEEDIEEQEENEDEEFTIEI